MVFHQIKQALCSQQILEASEQSYIKVKKTCLVWSLQWHDLLSLHPKILKVSTKSGFILCYFAAGMVMQDSGLSREGSRITAEKSGPDSILEAL